MIRTTTLWTAAAIAAFSVCPGTAASAAVPAHRADPVAVGLVRTTLRSAGVRATADRGRTTVYVGGDAANREPAAMRVPGPGGLPSGGYVLTAGDRRVVLSGADATGVFYAAQTLRQLLTGRNVPGVAVRDWPAMSLRGTIEGFYGPPWSAPDRLSHLDFLARTKQNVYVYSPKDDAYLRDKWRDPYPADRLADLGRLVRRATADHVDFTYALSPGLSVRYSSAADEKAPPAKFSSLWDRGVRAFAVPLDDVPIDTFNCAAARALNAYFAAMAAVPARLRAGLADPAFLDEAGPWIGKLGDYRQAGRTAVRLLLGVRAGDTARAGRERDLLGRQRDALAKISQRVAVGVLDPFVDKAEKTQGDER